VVQGEGPEFKPKYHTHTHKKETKREFKLNVVDNKKLVMAVL
jgi:hypothetical protein